MNPNRNAQPSSEPVEVHTRTRKITLDAREATTALAEAALNKAGLCLADGVSWTAHVWQSQDPYDGGPGEMNYAVTIIEDLTPICPPPDEAPTSPVAFRLFGQPKAIIEAHIVAECQPIKAKPRRLTEPTSFETLNTTATSSRENIEAIERMKEEQPALLWMEDLMKRVNKIHDVLLHGKGYNIVLSHGEVDTLLEYINAGALALDKSNAG